MFLNLAVSSAFCSSVFSHCILGLDRGDPSESRPPGCLDWECPVPSPVENFHSFIHSFSVINCLPPSGSMLGGQSAVFVFGELSISYEELDVVSGLCQGCNTDSTLSRDE